MSRMKLFLIFIIFSFFLSRADGISPAAQAKDDKAEPFTLKLLSGGDFISSELKGKVAVLKFVSSY